MDDDDPETDTDIIQPTCYNPKHIDDAQPGTPHVLLTRRWKSTSGFTVLDLAH